MRIAKYGRRRKIINDTKWLTRFMINVRSPCWSSSSGVGGNGRFGGPPAPCGGTALFVSSDRTLKPGLYENSGLIKSNQQKTKHKKRTNERTYETKQ